MLFKNKLLVYKKSIVNKDIKYVCKNKKFNNNIFKYNILR